MTLLKACSHILKLYFADVDIGPISVVLKIYEDSVESVDSESTGKAAVWPTSKWTLNKVPLIITIYTHSRIHIYIFCSKIILNTLAFGMYRLH